MSGIQVVNLLPVAISHRLGELGLDVDVDKIEPPAGDLLLRLVLEVHERATVRAGLIAVDNRLVDW